MDSTTMKGTVQGYFDRAFDEMTDKELETPLANSGLGVKAKLAPNSGTFVQFRKFGDSKFTDLIKGFEDKNNRVFGAVDMIDYASTVSKSGPAVRNLNRGVWLC